MVPTAGPTRTTDRLGFRTAGNAARRLAAVACLLALWTPASGGQESKKENARPGPGELQPADTTHSGQAVVVNDWGLDLYQVTLRHRRGNNKAGQEQMPWYDLAAGEASSPPLPFTYETGAGSPRDYWWVTFTVVGSSQAWCIKNNFYCSLTSEDDGQVTLTLIGDTQTMEVTFSSSSSCTVAVNQC